jgi:hypothetical protein
MDTTFIAGWISAMIDGEGSVQFGAYTDGRNGKPHQNLCVVVAHNTDLSVIETAGRYLDQLGALQRRDQCQRRKAQAATPHIRL